MISSMEFYLAFGMFFAMLLSAEPKRSAIALLVVVHAMVNTLSDYIDTARIYDLAILVETLAAIALIRISKTLIKDVVFYHLMAFFLLTSSLITILYKHDIIVSHEGYIVASTSIAITHVVVMLGYADGVRNGIRFIHDTLVSRGRSIPAFRSEIR